MIYAISYANDQYKKAQELNLKTALTYGADKVIVYSPEDIDRHFYEKNKEVLMCHRGNGYWLWKPYIIKKTLDKMEYGDYLIYADSGAYYINDIHYLIRCMEQQMTDIMLFSLPKSYLEKIWSKRDAFIIMECDSLEYTDTPQRLAGFIVIKKTKFVYEFIEEWLFYAQDKRIITDQKNCMGKDNYPGFRENRNDQTALSLLSKKYHLQCFRNPSCITADNDKEILEKSNYPKIFHLHRIGKVESVEHMEGIYNGYLDKLAKLWKEDKNMLLYGAGNRARKIISYLKSINKCVSACIVSDEQIIIYPEIEGIKVYHLSELPYLVENSEVIVTIDFNEVKEQLHKAKFPFVCIEPEIWNALRYFDEQKEGMLLVERK
nr:hypothetical protein [uncultured Acetatifactor sp.]